MLARAVRCDTWSRSLTPRERGNTVLGVAGVVTCAWREGYRPNAADGALIRLMVDHAVALIQRERLTSRRDVARTIVDTGVVPDPGPTATVGPA